MADTESPGKEIIKPKPTFRLSRRKVFFGCAATGCLLLFCGTLFLSVVGYQTGRELLTLLKSPFQPLIRTNITDDFQTYAEKTGQVNKLVLLERRSQEQISRRIDQTYAIPGLDQYSVSDHATIRIRCQVTMTYYVDLQEKWHLQLRDSRLQVLAPPIRIGPPAINPGKIEREVNGGWLVFGENAMLRQLEKELQVELRSAAMQPVNLNRFREECRQSLEKFIRAWLLNSRHQVSAIDIVFFGEPPRQTGK